MSDTPDLSGFDKEWPNIEPPENEEFEEVPDGTYQVVVDKVELKTSKLRDIDGGGKSGGNPMLKWQLKVLNPPHRGQKIFRHNMIITKDNIRWLKSDLMTCGLALEKLSHLQARLDELLDVQLEVKKTTKGEFNNVYFNRKIELGDAPATETNDSVPF